MQRIRGSHRLDTPPPLCLHPNFFPTISKSDVLIENTFEAQQFGNISKSKMGCSTTLVVFSFSPPVVCGTSPCEGANRLCNPYLFASHSKDYDRTTNLHLKPCLEAHFMATFPSSRSVVMHFDRYEKEKAEPEPTS